MTVDTSWLLAASILIGLMVQQMQAVCFQNCFTCTTPSIGSCLTCTTPAFNLNNGACCKLNEYFTAGLANCQPCHAACASCKGPFLTDCLTCASDSVLLATGTCVCNTGTSGFPNSCAPCDKTCTTCASTTAVSCLTCNSSRELAGPAPNACRCTDKFYQDSQGVCQPCNTLCKTCTGPGVSNCVSCEYGAVLQAGTCVCNATRTFQVSYTGACFPCHFSCASCSGPNDNNCLSCYAATMLNVGGTGMCGCPDGYYVNSTTSLCSICDPSCRKCSGGSSFNCTACYSSALVSSVGECVCPSGTTYTPAINTCDSCSQTCKSCSLTNSPTSCTSCYQYADLKKDGTCQCRLGYTWNPLSTACEIVDPNTCHLSCSTCAVPANKTSCLSCKTNAALTASSSCACQNSFSMNAAIDWSCLSCSTRCSNCYPNAPGPTFCGSCKATPALFFDSDPSAPTCYCQSGPGNYLVPNSYSSCVPCSMPCRTCEGSPTFCTSCQPLAVFNSTAGTCTCPSSGYQMDNSGRCVLVSPCPSLCLLCNLVSGVPSCTACLSFADLNAGACACRSGYYPGGSPVQCVPCHPTCATCSGGSASQCLSCKATASSVVLTSGTCICLSGYYMDGKAGLCYSCHPYCASCTSGQFNTCSSCVGGATLNGDGTCSCPSGFYRNSLTCSPCHISCKSCVGPGSSDCKDCKINAVLKNPGTCNCNVGAFMGPDGNCNNPCSPTCRTCFGSLASNCLTCDISAVLSGTTCICTAPSKQTSNGVCTSCHGSCLTCWPWSSLPTDCTACLAPATLQGDGSCKCPAGKYMDASFICQPCYSACLTCSGPTACTSINTASGILYLNTLSNFATCLDPTKYWDGSTCQPCTPPCSSCKGPTASDCLSCLDPVLMNLVAGVCKCKSRYVFEMGGCQACNVQCDGCFSTQPPNISHHRCTGCKLNEYGNPVAPYNEIDCSPSPGYSRDVDGNCYPPASCHRSCGGTSCSNTNINSCTSCQTNAHLRGGTSPNYCDCNTNFGFNPSFQCEACNPKCSLCSISNKDSCVSCRANTLGPGSGCTCLSTFFFNNATLQCENCHDSCATCFGARYDQCLTCPAGVTVSLGVCGCGAGKYLDSSPNCKTCSSSCVTCVDSSNFCTSCQASATLLNGACVCLSSAQMDGMGNCVSITCHPSCASCNGPAATDCTSCQSSLSSYINAGSCSCAANTWRSAGTCFPCDASCLSCTASATTCSTCKAGLTISGSTCTCLNSYYSIDANGACTAVCSADCSPFCSGPAANQCLRCSDPLMTLGASGCICPPMYFTDPMTGSCKGCHNSCAGCTGNLLSSCNACSPDKTSLITGVCTCAVNQVLGMNGLCQACHVTCASCTDVSQTGCLTCKSPYADIQADNSCKCRAGSAFDFAGQCVVPRCDTTCLTCWGTAPSQCLSCRVTAFLDSSGTCVCTSSNSYMDGNGNCLTCDQSCASCTGGSTTQCSSCKLAAVLTSKGKCSCTNNQKILSDGTCSATTCHFSCATCNGAGSATECLTCRAGALLDDGRQCICLSGTYMDMMGVCLSCHPRCLGCNNPSNTGCTACKSNAFLDADSSCQCSVGYSYATVTANICTTLTCDPSCLTCSGPLTTNCLTCRSGTGLTIDGRCICLTSTYLNAQGVCQACDPTCSTCSSPLATSCITCKPNGVLTYTGCQCYTGFYVDASFNCVACQITCLTCNGPLSTSCLTCKQGASLNLLTGACTPNPGFLMDPTTGLSINPSCDKSCLTCSGSTANNCLSCKSNAVLQPDKTCLCSSGFKADPSGNCNVILCYKACLTCANPSATGCLSCRSGAQLQGFPQGSCGCRAGYGYDDNFICKPCFPTCKTCLTIQNNTCIDCQPRLNKVSDGSCQCDLGFGYNTTSMSCANCSMSCKTCFTTDDTSCITCKSGNQMQVNNTCSCSPGLTLTPQGACSSTGCDYSCLTCSGPQRNQCLTCRFGAYLSSTSTCVCRSGVPMDNAGQCVLCYPPCARCTGPASTACTQCYPLAFIQSDGQCQCKDGYYFDVEYLSCLVCDISCNTCSTKSSTSCLSCREGAFLSGSGTCLCSSQISMAVDGSCLPCPTVCKSCKSDGRCATCYQNAQLDSKNGCMCLEGFYMAQNFRCELCHEKCATCKGYDELDCLTCKERAFYDFYSSSCVCIQETYFDNSMKSCLNCNQSINCLTCNTSSTCTTCKEGFNMTLDNLCQKPLSSTLSGPFNYSIEILHDQLFLYIFLDAIRPEILTSYIKSILGRELLNITQVSGDLAPQEFQWSPIPQSEYEWMKGIVRFRITITGSIEAFNATIAAVPSILPPSTSTSPSKRVLVVSDQNDQPKQYLVPTFSYISEDTVSIWFYVFCGVYSLTICIMLFLTFVRPFVKRWRDSAKTFWLVRVVMWFQLIMLTGFVSTEFRGSLDQILLSISESSLRYFGLDTEISFFSSDVSRENFRNGYYVGKYTGKDKTPYLLQRMLVPSFLYILLWVGYLIVPRRLITVKEVWASVRTGLGMSFGVQLLFMAGVNWVAFLGTGVYTVYALAGLLYSLVVVGFLWIEVFQLKGQLLGKTSLLVGASTKGVLAFDLEIWSNTKRSTVISRVVIDETELLFISALLIGLLGRSPGIQSSLLAALSLVQTIVVTYRREQESKLLVMLQNLLHLILRLFLLGYSFTRRDNPLTIVQTVSGCFLGLLLLCLLLTVLEFAWRVYKIIRPFTQEQESKIMAKFAKGFDKMNLDNSQDQLNEGSNKQEEKGIDLNFADILNNIGGASQNPLNTHASAQTKTLSQIKVVISSKTKEPVHLQMTLENSLNEAKSSERTLNLQNVTSEAQNNEYYEIPQKLGQKVKSSPQEGVTTFTDNLFKKDWKTDLQFSSIGNESERATGGGLNLNREGIAEIKNFIEGRDEIGLHRKFGRMDKTKIDLLMKGGDINGNSASNLVSNMTEKIAESSTKYPNNTTLPEQVTKHPT